MSGGIFATIKTYFNGFDTNFDSYQKKIFAVAIIAATALQLCLIIASVTFMIMILNKVTWEQLIKNPLNRDTLAYSVANSCTLAAMYKQRVTYPYVLFALFTYISFSILVAVILYMLYMLYKKVSIEFTPIIWILFWVGLVQSVVMLIATETFFRRCKPVLDNLYLKIQEFNDHVNKYIYKTPGPILNHLSSLPTHGIDVSLKITEVLCLIDNKTSAEDIVRIFFSLNIYRHFLKNGLRDVSTEEALSSVFSNVNASINEVLDLAGTSMSISSSPADFLPYGIHSITDYSYEYINILTSLGIESLGIDVNTTLKTAINDVKFEGNNSVNPSQLTSRASEMANSFFADDALNSFYTISTTYTLAAIVPFIIVLYQQMTRNSTSNETIVGKVSNIIGSIRDKLSKP